MGASQDRHRDKNLTNHVAIQACANKILENKHNGVEEYPKEYGGGTLRSAIRLLIFEGLLSRRNDITLNDKGKKHIADNGFFLYPLDSAKNLR